MQVRVRPPNCPELFPALLYISRGVSDGQIVYSGGWIIDDAALYEASVTVLSMAGPTEVVGIELSDLGASFEDVAGGGDAPRRVVMRRRRGARLDSGTVNEVVKAGVLSESAGEDIVVRKRPGREASEVSLEVTGDEYGFVTHVALDAPVLHLVNAGRASNEVKFKAGAELSKGVN
ncbi:hypothetical protein DVK02_12795 [Halobellus sp. Atlit-31R]|nr:hypothetical protein DVK02_12795 [Halobellus sp. Atlit-31R]